QRADRDRDDRLARRGRPASLPGAAAFTAALTLAAALGWRLSGLRFLFLWLCGLSLLSERDDQRSHQEDGGRREEPAHMRPSKLQEGIICARRGPAASAAGPSARAAGFRPDRRRRRHRTRRPRP